MPVVEPRPDAEFRHGFGRIDWSGGSVMRGVSGEDSVTAALYVKGDVAIGFHDLRLEKKGKR